jgi:hypothetical protein
MKIIFLTNVPFSQRDFDRFGVEVLKEHKVAVECWDMTEMLNKKAWKQRKVEAFKFFGYIGVSSMSLIKKMCKNIGDAIVIDLLGTGFTCNWVRRLIRKSSAKICVSEQALLANEIFRETKILHKVNLERMVVKFTGYGISSFFKSSMTAVHEKIRPEASYRLMSGTASLGRSDKYIRNAKKIWAHSFDYNTFLKLRDQASSKNIIVFIDTGPSGGHPDLKLFKAKPFSNAENYYPAMNKVFNSLELFFNAPVVIAGHPKIDYSREKDIFEHREILFEKTAELIRDCKLVVSNGSTADNFAVLWKKPILFITTDELENSPQKKILEAECKLLDTKVINANHFFDDIDWGPLCQKPLAKYDAFRNQIIKKDGTPDENCWAILVDYFEGKQELSRALDIK